ncbi:hypothetical protein Sfulv_07750 [Streptomyces fulvorobeus]|uniref:Uncharacterized protein n=1 Tax=Streptomyces fulvorobeus TaxID=284028 RepID=A0A7J0C1X8_9ACTN|nr:hypothetical protein Sfulv_07750 [Streptomyces fulvorobeus]
MSSDDERSAGPDAGAPEQLALIRETVRRARVPRAKPRTWRGAALAKELPVARVLVNKGVLHLDQYFDYAVPKSSTRRPGPASGCGCGSAPEGATSGAADARAAD